MGIKMIKHIEESKKEGRQETIKDVIKEIRERKWVWNETKFGSTHLHKKFDNFSKGYFKEEAIKEADELIKQIKEIKNELVEKARKGDGK